MQKYEFCAQTICTAQTSGFNVNLSGLWSFHSFFTPLYFDNDMNLSEEQ